MPLQSIAAHISWNYISNLRLQRANKALRDDLVLPSATTHRNICSREYALTLDRIKTQLLSRNTVSLDLDECRSPNKLGISSVIAYNMDRDRAFQEVQFAFAADDRLFLSRFES